MNCESCGGPLTGKFIKAEPYTVRFRKFNKSAHVIYAEMELDCEHCGSKLSIMEDISRFLNAIFPLSCGEFDA